MASVKLAAADTFNSTTSLEEQAKVPEERARSKIEKIIIERNIAYYPPLEDVDFSVRFLHPPF
jgi:hypothetical protein